MDPVSFVAGVALGILATCAGSTLFVWRLIRRAPVIDYNAEDPAETARWERGKAAPPLIMDAYHVAGYCPTTLEIERDLRGPVTVYPPFTPPLIDLEDPDA